MAPFCRCSFSRWSLNYSAKLPPSFSVPVWIFNLWIKSEWYRKLNIIHQLIYVALINIIKSINHFFAMPRCTYTLINYDGVTLWNHWHKVHFRGTYVLFSTTISVFPYFTQWCVQYIFVFDQWKQYFSMCSSSGSILFAVFRLKKVKHCMMLTW